MSLANVQMSGVGGHTWRDRSCKWRRSRKRDVDEPYEKLVVWIRQSWLHVTLAYITSPVLVSDVSDEVAGHPAVHKNDQFLPPYLI